MLVLARQPGQSVVIGDNVEVMVVSVRGDKVRLGITAPDDVPVHRKEVYEAIQRERSKNDATKATSAVPAPPNSPSSTDVEFLRAALEEARKGFAEGGLPIGAVLIRDGEIIGRGHNRRVQQGDPVGHAEIDCLRQAGRQQTYRDTVLYSTLMPCYLCGGAAVQFGIPKVVIGESVNFGGAQPQFMASHGVQIVDLNDPECISMMSDFIKAHPQLWHEDIGK